MNPVTVLVVLLHRSPRFEPLAQLAKTLVAFLFSLF